MNIMVILRNIKKTDNSISTDYYPEGEKLKGFMKIRIKDGEILEHDNASSFSAAHGYSARKASRAAPLTGSGYVWRQAHAAPTRQTAIKPEIMRPKSFFIQLSPFKISFVLTGLRNISV